MPFLPSIASEPARTAFLKGQPFAHRGLHGGGIIENSQAAFRAAIAIGHGIELDVQPARDGEAFVFHDATLDRLTASSGPVAARSARDLAAVALRGTGETLVRLDAVLRLIGGRVPVLIEVKSHAPLLVPLCLSVRRALEGYGGAAAVMSFDPRVAQWFAEHAPYVVRGLVVTEQDARGLAGGAKRLLAMLRAKPEFLAYDVRDLPSTCAARARARGLPVLTWTVRSAAAERIAQAHADEVIYERPQ